MLPDTRTPPPIPGMWRHESETSFPNAASNGEAELAQESVAAEGAESAAANTSAPRHKRSPCWRRDLMSGRGQRGRTYRYSCKSLPMRLSTRKSNRLRLVKLADSGKASSTATSAKTKVSPTPTPQARTRQLRQRLTRFVP